MTVRCCSIRTISAVTGYSRGQYAHERESGEIAAFVWGKRDLETALALKNKLSESGITFGRIATDNWKSFRLAFSDCRHIVGKKFTLGIEGNNCRLRHRLARAVRALQSYFYFHTLKYTVLSLFFVAIFYSTLFRNHL